MADTKLFLDINGRSSHRGVGEGLPDDFKYNENNKGFGITAEKEAKKIVKALHAGGYKNSFGDNSYYLAGSLGKRFGDNFYADVGVTGGVVTGYDKAKAIHDGKEYSFNDYKKFNPLGGLYVNLGKKDAARLGIKYVPGKPNVIMMNFSTRIK